MFVKAFGTHGSCVTRGFLCVPEAVPAKRPSWRPTLKFQVSEMAVLCELVVEPIHLDHHPQGSG